MYEEEDVKRIVEGLKCSKVEHNTLDFEIEEFISYEDSDVEEIDYNNKSIVNNLDDDDDIFCDLLNTDISTLNTYDPRSSLKPEERVVIDSCNDSDLKNILLLNRTKNIQLIQLYKKMKDLLIECQQNITEKNKIIKAYSTANKGQTNSTGAWRLAAPYFKDIQLYCSPPNEDTLQKKKNKELSIYDLSPLLKWSRFECEKLIKAVKLNYNINQQSTIRKKIEELSIDGDTGTNIELEELKGRLEELDVEEVIEIPPLNSDEHIDWNRVTDVFLKDKHSAFECRSMWHLYLHPLINKSTWSPAENANLKALVKKHEYQNWDQIAKELGGNRTGFTICMNYYGNLHNKFKKGEFTYQEDARLLDLVCQHRMGNYIPWYKVAQHFKDRTRSQLHYRYTYYLSQNDKRKGKFTEAEDILLMILVDKFGKNFKKCCEYLPTRSMVQCKSRYNSNLQNSIKKGSFTIEEDEIILKYVEEHGTKVWTNLTKLLKRSRGQIRQRYVTIRQFLDGNPEMTLDLVPRRKHNLKTEEESFHYQRLVADEYLDNPMIPSLEQIMKILKGKKKEIGIVDVNTNEKGDSDKELPDDAPPKVNNIISLTFSIDDMLTDFFCNSFKMNSQKSISCQNLTKAVDDVRTVLNVLGVDLDVPVDFHLNTTLDSLDVAILNRFLENPVSVGALTFNSENRDIINLIPPNLNNIVGLRSLLIKFSKYKSAEYQEMGKFYDGVKKQHYVNDVRSGIVNHLQSLQPDVRKQVESERRLFYRRFVSLFKWPAIMTLEGPNAELLSTTKSSIHKAQLQVKRTYSKAITIADDPASKRSKPNQNVANVSKAVPLKLTPVTNKSVIEDLLRNKNKKLFCFDKVKYGEETKTIIREIPLPLGANIKKKLLPNRPVKQEQDTTKKCTVQNMLESSVATSSTQAACEQASSSNQELFQFNSAQGECVITDVDDGESVFSYGGSECFVDDDEDVKKLDMFLTERYEQLETEENEDFKDLRRLEMSLKKEKNVDNEPSEAC